MARPPYPDYQDRCGWNAMLPARAPNPPATGAMRVKYAVVGAGFTGLAAARRLHELDPMGEIVVLEAITVGEGSSARNSGFANPRDTAFGLSPEDVRRGEALNGYAAEGFGWLVALMEQHGFECELSLTGRITAAATEAGEAKVRSLLEGARLQKVPHAHLDAAELKEIIGSGYYRSGFRSEEGYLLQPAKLIRGLADALPAAIRLHENSPVLRIEKSKTWEITTPDARISADVIVMAANASIKHFGYLRDRVVTIYTYAGITEAMSEADAAQLGSAAEWGLLPAHRLGTTVRRVGADRLMVRSLYSYEQGLPADVVRQQLTSCFHRRYPALRHVGLEYVWGGTTGLTMNGAPNWGKFDDNLYGFAGCNGSGVVKGTVLGKRLAEAICGTPQAELEGAYGRANWIAPEPFRSIGFTVVSAIERRKASLEM
jgi:glycine/D-amino acid oxidase-like deaminating enzyme